METTLVVEEVSPWMEWDSSAFSSISASHAEQVIASMILEDILQWNMRKLLDQGRSESDLTMA